MKEKLRKLVLKYELSETLDKIQDLDNPVQVQVGFVGEFSSGKSSLINALLGRKVLPAMVSPTTGSITLVIPTEGIETNAYLLQNLDGEYKPTSVLEFQEVATGKKQGTAVVKVPPTDLLASGYTIVDTPGVQSLVKTHTDITFGYLPLLDGIVLCHDANKGDLPNSLLDFFCRVDVVPLMRNLLLAITHIDQTTNSESIKAKVVFQLDHCNKKNSLGLGNVKEHVVTVASIPVLDKQQGYTLEAFNGVFNHVFVEKKVRITEERKQVQLKRLARDTLNQLNELLQNFQFGDEDLKNKEEELNEHIEALEREEINEKQKLDGIRNKIRTTLIEIAENYVPIYSGATEEEVAEVSKSLVKDISKGVEPLLRGYAENVTVPPMHGSTSGIERYLSNVLKGVDITTTIVTALIVAVASGGTSTAANVGESIVGGAAKKLGSSAAKQNAKQAGKKIAEESAKASLKSVMGKTVLNFVATLDKVNPVVYAGDFIGRKVIESGADTMLRNMAKNVANQISADVEFQVNERVFRPLQKKLADAKRALSHAWKEKRKSSDHQQKFIEALENDIEEMSQLLK